MALVLIIIYGITTIVYIPLFALIMVKLKREYKLVYDEIKIKLFALFCVLILFLVLRFYMYIDIKFYHVIYQDITLYAEIPFYITEIIITLTVSYILYSISGFDRETSLIGQ